MKARQDTSLLGGLIGAKAAFWAIGSIWMVVLAVWSLGASNGWAFVLASLVLGVPLSALSYWDVKSLRLPDRGTLPLLVAGLAVGLARHPDMIADHLLGAIAGYLIFAVFSRLYYRLRGREGLGLGDAKLLAAGGAWVAWQGLVSVVLVASLAAILVSLLAGLAKDQQYLHRHMPFGPFLALGIWIVWLYGPFVWGTT